MTALPPGPPADCPPAARALYAPHRRPGTFFNRGAFFNPWERFSLPPWAVLRWWLSPNRYDRGDPPQVPSVPWDGRRLGERPEAAVTWVGHATFAIEDGGGGVALTDPHFGRRALLPRRHLPPGLPLAAVPEEAVAVLSHNHYDHLDLLDGAPAAGLDPLVRAPRARPAGCAGTGRAASSSSTGGRASKPAPGR
jgi:hypothetical protein